MIPKIHMCNRHFKHVNDRLLYIVFIYQHTGCPVLELLQLPGFRLATIVVPLCDWQPCSLFKFSFALTGLCSQKCMPCVMKTQITLPCQHNTTIACHMQYTMLREEILCKENCDKVLACGHKCQKK